MVKVFVAFILNKQEQLTLILLTQKHKRIKNNLSVVTHLKGLSLVQCPLNCTISAYSFNNIYIFVCFIFLEVECRTNSSIYLI